MISIYHLKPKFQNLLRPLAKKIYDLGGTANMVTLFAMFSSICVALLLYWQGDKKLLFLILPFFLFFRMALNAIDGMLAREWNQKSTLGGIYNEIGDIISDSFLFLAFFPIFSQVLLFSLVIFSATTEVIGILAQSYIGERRYDGPMGKSDRAFVLSCIAIIYAFSWLKDKTISFLFLLMLVLVIYTCYNRVQAILKKGR